jgi:hypothetical protein
MMRYSSLIGTKIFTDVVHKSKLAPKIDNVKKYYIPPKNTTKNNFDVIAQKRIYHDL